MSGVRGEVCSQSVGVEAAALAGIRIEDVLVDPFALFLIQIGGIRSWQFIENGFNRDADGCSGSLAFSPIKN